REVGHSPRNGVWDSQSRTVGDDYAPAPQSPALLPPSTIRLGDLAKAAKVPRSARKRGRCGERQRKQRLPSSISLQHRTPMGGISLGKARKKMAQQFVVLLSGEFYGFVDSWTEYLCLARHPDGSITLTSRSREILAESGRYRERG